MLNSTNTVIIGSGVAGMTAAMYLKRANIPFILIEKSAPGGQINRASLIENYPGIESIDGPSLAMNLYNQISKMEIDIKFGEVQNIEIKQNKKIISINDEKIECENIIVATGRNPKELGLENEKYLTGHGVSWCALCDGHFYKDKDVAVVGAGNSAFEEALYLANICKTVYIIHRSSNFKAEKNLVEKVKNTKNIIIKENVNIEKLNIKDEYLDSITLDNKEILDIKGLFIYIGSIPDISFLSEIGIKDDNGYLIVNQNMETNIEGIYACGDVINKNVYQLTTAIGEAATAANSIIFKNSHKN